jgi:hypothetical protein
MASDFGIIQINFGTTIQVLQNQISVALEVKQIYFLGSSIRRVRGTSIRCAFAVVLLSQLFVAVRRRAGVAMYWSGTTCMKARQKLLQQALTAWFQGFLDILAPHASPPWYRLGHSSLLLRPLPHALILPSVNNTFHPLHTVYYYYIVARGVLTHRILLLFHF